MENIYRKYFNLLMVAIALMLGSFNAHAATGWCNIPSGVPFTFNFNMNYNLVDPSQNYAGKTISNAYNWSLGSQYAAHCDTNTSQSTTFFKGDNPSVIGHTDGSLTYYVVNEYLQVAPSIGMVSSCGYPANRPVPFTDHSNGCSFTPAATTTFASGNQGSLALYFTKPFVGQMIIPSTVVARLFASQVQGSYSSTPLAQVIMNGVVTVPQSCNINAGQIINIDFGDILASNIQVNGAIPIGLTPKVVNMTLACSNISAGVNISLSINGTAAQGDSTALATTNPNIGIRFWNSSGVKVSPNLGRLPVVMNYAAQTGTSSMTIAPINVTGSIPSVGDFSAIATLNAEMQ